MTDDTSTPRPAGFDLSDAAVVAGVVAVVYGLALIYPPVAWIVGGLATAALGLLRG